MELPSDANLRRELLYTEYGKPDFVPLGAVIALRELGIRERIHPQDVLVFRYRDAGAFEAYSEANRLYNASVSATFGPLVEPSGTVLGVLMLAEGALHRKHLNPRLPDNWRDSESD